MPNVASAYGDSLAGVYVTPSGDGTGAKDYALLSTLLANEEFVWMGPGTWQLNNFLQMTQNAQTFIGVGYQTTNVNYVGAASIAAQLIVGPTAVIQNVTVGAFRMGGNANSGHNIQWRAKISKLQDVILQIPQSDCLHLDPGTIGGNINQVVFQNVQGIHPGSNGFFTDTHVSDSDFAYMTFDGGTSGDTVTGGNIGVNLTGGSYNRFYGLHPYLFTNGGVSCTALSGCEFFGGEFESNGTADLILNNVHNTTFSRVGFYDHANPSPPTQHVLFTGTASGKVELAGCTWREDTYTVPNFYTNSNNSNANIHDCPGFNPVGLLTPPTYTAGTALTNPFPFPCRVFVTGATAVAINGTATGLAGPCSVLLGYNESITPTGAGAWVWFGV